ncbi:MAG: methyltransferase domain-containing protein [Gemmatimonadales bacterium]
MSVDRAAETRGERASDWYEERLRGTAYLAGRRRKARVIAELCREELAAAERIADLGSGTGIIKNVLENTFSKPIIGIELTEHMVVERRGMVRGDILRLPIADQALDFVMMNHVYEHVGDHGRLFAEALRVLRPGGQAFVSAGNRFALIEPHYRLPLLSWLPSAAANAYLRSSGRGRRYDDIRYLSYGRLQRVMSGSGFRVRDITRRALDDLIATTWGPAWERTWMSFRVLPTSVVDRALRALSPQWFFMLERPAS